MYAIGIDLGEPMTSWARTTQSNETDAQGTIQSAVNTAANGSLQVAESSGRTGDGTASESVADQSNDWANEAVTGFVSSLGSSEPVMVSGTPYGVEALIACVLATAVEASAVAVGAQPDVVALVHDDDLDAYVVSLLNEAARVAGIPSDRLLLVPRSAAGESAAVGASQLGFASLPESQVESSGRVGGIAAATGGLAFGATVGSLGAAGVAGAAVLGAELGGAAVTSVAGPSGTSAGPAGSSAGPGGSTIGPTGTTIGPVSAGGAAGPAGSGAIVAGRSWVPMAIAGAAVVVVAVAAVAVVFAGGEASPPDEASAAITVDTPIVVSIATTATADSAFEPAETTADADTSTTLNPDIDLSAFVGDWELCQPSATSPSISAAVRYSFAPAGPNQLTIDYSIYVFTDAADCSGAGLTSGEEQTYTIDIVGETVVDGIPVVQATAPDAAWLMGVDGDTLRYGSAPSTDGFPVAFDPVSVYSRRS